MCQGKPRHAAGVWIFLIAVAIQGATPDAHNLASLNSIRVLCPFLSWPEKLADNDDLPDEVCGPIQPETHAVLRGKDELGCQSGFAALSTVHAQLLPVAVEMYRTGCRDAANRQRAELTHSLCRLQC
jgi:hypothetical protein